MREVIELVKRVAPTQSTVLITGESGTGKEVVARAIHHFSAGARAHLPARQLRGHPREPAREPALRPRARRVHRRRHRPGGPLQPRHGGTIFLDEIGDMPLGLQSKLLRAIEAKEILPVGGTQPINVDVRIIAATNRDLGADGRRGHVPRGPLLPPERGRHRSCRRCASAARTSRRWSSTSSAGTTAR